LYATRRDAVLRATAKFLRGPHVPASAEPLNNVRRNPSRLVVVCVGRRGGEKAKIVAATIATMMVETATLQVHRDTKELLKRARRPGETFDHLIRRTLAEAQANSETAFLREVQDLLDDRGAMRPLR